MNGDLLPVYVYDVLLAQGRISFCFPNFGVVNMGSFNGHHLKQHINGKSQ